MANHRHYDLILVGGGLANGMIAWRLKQLQPAISCLILEQADRLGGNHTWSFYDSDVTPAQYDWLQPLIGAHWDHYQVKFPHFTRTLPTGYNSITSEQFHTLLAQDLGDAVRFNATVTAVTANSVTVNDEIFQAQAVLDGRGHTASTHMHYAYQKFVGLDVELTAPHNLSSPIIMDATVSQIDGYRFVYSLPFSPMRLLIEDTRYSDTPDVDAAALQNDVLAYAVQQGWSVKTIIRSEIGVLPITLSGEIERFWQDPLRQHPCTGLRAGLFHPTTGYSLPNAVQLADKIAHLTRFDSADLHDLIRTTATRLWRQQCFFRILNRMLFYAAKPHARYAVLQRFYRLPAPLIARFYAGRLKWHDIIRILAGKPPVAVHRALAALFKTNGTS